MPDSSRAREPHADDLIRGAGHLNAESVLALIRAMPDREPVGLFRMLAVSRPWQLGMVMCHEAEIEKIADLALSGSEAHSQLFKVTAQLDRARAETDRKLKRMLVKPRNTERDQEIIRLRGEGKTHGRI